MRIKHASKSLLKITLLLAAGVLLCASGCQSPRNLTPFAGDRITKGCLYDGPFGKIFSWETSAKGKYTEPVRAPADIPAPVPEAVPVPAPAAIPAPTPAAIPAAIPAAAIPSPIADSPAASPTSN